MTLNNVLYGFHFQIAAISEQVSESSGDPNTEKSSRPLGWKSFDMHAVVDATEDLILFILSDKGSRVRLFLLWDIIEAADVFLQDEVIDCLLNEKPQGQRVLLLEVILKFMSWNKYLNKRFLITERVILGAHQNNFRRRICYLKPSGTSSNG